jgi:ABC-type uncharacterized transport system permease subunit
MTECKVLGAALGRVFRLLAIGSVVGMILGVLATRVLPYLVYQATPKDPIVLGGVVLTMLAVGLVARCAFSYRRCEQASCCLHRLSLTDATVGPQKHQPMYKERSKPAPLGSFPATLLPRASINSLESDLGAWTEQRC